MKIDLSLKNAVVMTFRQKWQNDDIWRKKIIKDCESAGKEDGLSSDIRQACRWGNGCFFVCPGCPLADL